jgi:hypothetical protein
MFFRLFESLLSKMDPEDLKNIHTLLRHMEVTFYQTKLESYPDNFSTKEPEKFNMKYSKFISLLKDQSIDEIVRSTLLKLRANRHAKLDRMGITFTGNSRDYTINIDFNILINYLKTLDT